MEGQHQSAPSSTEQLNPAAAYVLLASDEASYISGTRLGVRGRAPIL